MDWKFFFIGAVAGGVVAYFRVKGSPTALTHNAPGFGG